MALLRCKLRWSFAVTSDDRLHAMGKKSSAVAKERRAAKRLEEQQQERKRGMLAGVYTEQCLAGMRTAIRAEFPEIGASMAVKAVDVICLQATAAPHPADKHGILMELQSELRAHMSEQGYEEQQGVDPVLAMCEIIAECAEYHYGEVHMPVEEAYDTSAHGGISGSRGAGPSRASSIGAKCSSSNRG